MPDAKEYLHYLLKQDKILIYGAGHFGSRIISLLRENDYDAKKLIVWDKNFAKIVSIDGLKVLKPNFANFENKDIPVITAFNPDINARMLKETKDVFAANGFTNIVPTIKILQIFDPCVMHIDDFYAAVESNNMYNCEYEDDYDFSVFEPKVKAIAYYLPQFHEIPENSEWWGEGFTEWSNTKKARPLFKGHYQPREPHDDIGYYDLTDAETIRKQAKLARSHGIYGWCLYYYWFSGRKLLEKPIDILLENKDIDINFCLMWANESWTRNWVGDRTVLVEQTYLEDDPYKLIDDLKKYMSDSRYIRVDGKALLVIYYPGSIPDFETVADKWRKRALDIGIGELYIMMLSLGHTPKTLGIEKIIDGAAAFSFFESILKDTQKVVRSEDGELEFMCVMDYKDYVNKYKAFLECDRERERESFFRAVFCCYDTSPRFDRRIFGFRTANYNFSMKNLFDFADVNVKEAIETKKEFMFIFSWNEWAEGAYIEPDKKYGYAVINTISKAICQLPLDVCLPQKSNS